MKLLNILNEIKKEEYRTPYEITHKNKTYKKNTIYRVLNVNNKISNNLTFTILIEEKERITITGYDSIRDAEKEGWEGLH